MSSFARAFICVQVPLAAIWSNDGLPERPIYDYKPAPSFLVKRLKAVPRRLLSESEREAFKRDGVVVVRDVIQDMRVLDHFDNFETDWRKSHSGRMFALLRDGPLGALAASALGVSEVRVLEASIWMQPMRLPFGLGSIGNWHQDYAGDDGQQLPIVTTWLSLSEDARALAFALGSHKRVATQFCTSPHPWQIWNLPDDCVQQAYNGSIQDVVFNMGDVVLFQGQILHQGVNRGEPRAAIAVRWVAARAQFTARNFHSNDLVWYGRYLPRECGTFDSPVFPMLYPAENFTDVWPVIPTTRDVLFLAKYAEAYNWGWHRSYPKCKETWDHGADL